MAEIKVPAADTAKRWARVALRTGPVANPKMAEAGAQALYALCGIPWKGAVWVDDPAEANAFIGECGDSINKQAVSNRVVAAVNWLSDAAPSTCLGNVSAEYRRLAGTGVGRAYSLLGPSSTLAGQGSAEILAAIDYALSRCRHPDWLGKWFAAYAAVVKNCWEFFLGRQGCVLLGHPTTMQFNAAGQLHSLTGPALAWPGWEHFAVHGVQVPGLFITDPDTLNIHTVLNEPNQERRRAFVLLYGEERLLREAGTLVAQDDWGKLWSLQTGDRDEPLVMVQVLNSTAEPDGTFKDYFLRVAPDLRPLGGREQLAFGGRVRWVDGQEITPLNAVASTFGMTGEEYAKALEFQS